MSSAGVLNRSEELWQQSTAKWQQSTTKWQQSTTEAWRRSATAWHDSKDRCHQTTMEAWHKSADSWKHSKDMCRQSTAGMLARSANRIYQSTDRLQHMNLLEQQPGQKKPPTEQSSKPSILSTTNISQTSRSPQAVQPAETKSLPETNVSQPETSASSPPSQSSPVSSISSPPIPSPQSASETGFYLTATSSLFVDLSIKRRRPDEQIRGLLKFTDHVSTQVQKAKRLRDVKSSQLGEIEHNWINSTIVDADDSARELAGFLEPCRSDMAKRKGKGKISSTNRKQWKFQGCGRAEEKQARLVRYQCRLDRVLRHLENLEISPKAPAQELGLKTTTELSVAEPAAKSAELSSDAPPDAVAELPSDVLPKFEIAVAELPSSSAAITRKPVPFIAELPGDSTIICVQPARMAIDIPKIIVTSAPDESSFTIGESPGTTVANPESKELNETLAWKETK